MPNRAEPDLSALLESTDEMIWSVDVDLRLRTFNRALRSHIERSFGVRQGAVLPLEDLLPPVLVARCAPLLKKALRDGASRVEFPMPDGRTLEMAFNPIVSDGETTGVSIFAKDITDRKTTERALQEVEKRYRDIFDGALEGIFETSLEGSLVSANRALARMLGYGSPDELVAAVKDAAQHVPVGPQEISLLTQCIAEQEAVQGRECQFRRKDGSLTWVKVTASTQCDGDGRILRRMGLVEDIDARKQAEERLVRTGEALRASEERYRVAFQTSHDAIAISRLSDGVYIDCNQAFLKAMGYERSQVIGRKSLELGIWAESGDRQRLVDLLGQDPGCRDLEVQFRRKSGELFWVRMSASLIELDGVSCILAVMRDISDAKRAADEIRSLAFYDPLTRLPNRRQLLEQLRQTLAAGAGGHRKRGILFIDLDHFKTLNDTLGHQAGDLLLQEVARRLSSCTRDSGAVARLGGDEFVVVLEDLGGTVEDAAAHAKTMAGKILDAVAQACVLDGHECLITCSIGITVFADPQVDGDDVLQQADIAMYQAKAAGGNTIRFFAPALQAAVNARATLEEDLRQAIKSNQFLLYYQPQVDRGRLVGAEALLRWNHPRRGVLAPGEFIPLAEETGLILPLGSWVMESACRQIAAWAGCRETAHIALAVNISARQLHQPDFVDQVLTSLENAGANPGNLKLELTESMLVENIEDVIAKMTELKAHGLRFSLDDFGTGYSSLSYLKRLPLDQLKIDRSFVRDILMDASSGAIAQTIISLSRAMGLSVIAEGVETEAQRRCLARLGCHAFQGYLFSRPVPLEAFQQLVPGCAEVVVPTAQ